MGFYLKQKLESICPRVIRAIRGEGLFVGLEVEDGKNCGGEIVCRRIQEMLREKGILVGIQKNVILIRPSLCILQKDIGIFIREIEKCF